MVPQLPRAGNRCFRARERALSHRYGPPAVPPGVDRPVAILSTR